MSLANIGQHRPDSSLIGNVEYVVVVTVDRPIGCLATASFNAGTAFEEVLREMSADTPSRPRNENDRLLVHSGEDTSRHVMT